MAICPFAVQQIIPESYTQGSITPTTLIYHRAVSSAESLQSYWNTPGVELESHFYIGQFGTLYQFMDTNVRADANVDANGFAISVETWDGGNTPDDMPWNPAQLATAKRLAAWVCDTHGVRRGAAQTWNGGGIGGHNWFPYPWAGGPRGCPGTARNAQIRNDIIPYVAAGGGWRTAVEDDMPLTPNDGNVLWAAADPVTGKVETHKLADWIGLGTFYGLYSLQRIAKLEGVVAGLATLVTQAIADDQDIDLAAIEAAAEKGAREGTAESLKSLPVEVDINLAGDRATPTT